LPPAVALLLAITIIFNDSFFFYTAAQLGNWREWKARKRGIDGVPGNASRARRDLFCATSGRYLLITRKRFRTDNVDIVDRSRYSRYEYASKYFSQKRISEEFKNIFYLRIYILQHNYFKIKISGLFLNSNCGDKN